MNSILALNPSVIRPIILKWRPSLKAILILSFVLVVLLSGFYIFQLNEMTSSSFAISSYEKQITKLAQESKSLELNFSSMSSLTSLDILLNSLNYEEVGKIHYIQVMEGSVVTK